jgi:trigger factor
MQVSVETTGGLERRIKVQIPADQIDQQVESKLQQLARSVRLDGFRPGKVPLSVVRKRYGDQVRQETAGELIASSYEEALQRENLKPAGDPRIEQTRNEPGQELEFVATFEVYPEVEPPDLADITIERMTSEVTDADVDSMLEKLRRQRVTWGKVERAAEEGDRIEIDFEGTIDGTPFSGNSANNVPLELGSKSMIPGFEEQLVGVSAGESKTIEVTFPDDYGSSEVAGKTASFDVKVHAVAEAQLPELNDEFARVFGVGDGGLAQLREEIRRNMERELAAVIKSRVKQQVFDALLEKAETAADAGADRGRYEDEARRRVSLGLLIAEIIRRNQLQIDPERVRETVENLAQSYEKPEEVVQWYYSNQEMLAGIQTLIMEETVVEWVAGQTKVLEKSITFDEIMQA